MSNHHKHPHDHTHNHPHEKHGRKLHKDWRLWVAVGLMLVCMLIYIFTLDLAIWPNTKPAGNPPPTNTVPAQK